MITNYHTTLSHRTFSDLSDLSQVTVLQGWFACSFLLTVNNDHIIIIIMFVYYKVVKMQLV